MAGQWRLTSAIVTFNTLNDDKRADTVISISVKDVRGREVARAHGTFGKFADESTTSIPMGVLHSSVEPNEVRGGIGAVEFQHTGNDEWHCNFHINLSFRRDDGSETAAVTGHSEPFLVFKSGQRLHSCTLN